MKISYIPKEIEFFVQTYWYEQKTFKVVENLNKEKYYCLSMFPYPSGRLHMGHVRNYTIGDVIARYQRMLGKNVLHPIGWDAFGLPAENAAIKNNIAPDIWTYKNIKYMRNQLKMLGFSYDWSREITTCHPSYYKWEQWFFIELYKKKLVYKKKSLVNWCPKDQTVLANEQVIDNGYCWRCNTKIKKKNIMQWFIKITQYADELFSNLDFLKNWPKQVRVMQHNWIGRTEGIEINFDIINNKRKITVYIDSLNILEENSYILLSPTHELSIYISQNNKLLFNFIKNNNLQSEIGDYINVEKKGIYTGLYAINPLNGKLLPILIVNFLLINNINYDSVLVSLYYKDYNLDPSILFKVITFKNNDYKIDQEVLYLYQKVLFNNIKYYSMNVKKDIDILKNKLLQLGGKRVIKYRLRDWCISRQRYWGAPIPMLILNNNIIPVSQDKLPIVLPKDIIVDFLSNKIKVNPNWLNTMYQGVPVLRESDTFDTFMESSWYYARYTCPNYDNGMLNLFSANYWLPVDQYVGGIEHATMHLIYFRFFHKLLRDFGFVSGDEPVKKLLCQGMVVSDSFYYISSNGERIWVSPNDVIVKRDKNNRVIKALDLNNKELVYNGISKMSKSKNNGIDPELIIEKYGADTLRLFIMFAAPIEMNLEWRESGIKGIYRFLKRLWKFAYQHIQRKVFNNKIDILLLNNSQKEIYYYTQKIIIKVTNDINNGYKFNTAIAAIMTLLNKLELFKPSTEQDFLIQQEILIIIIKMLYPFTPHICFFLLKELLGNEHNIDYISWPLVNTKIITQNINDKCIVIIQINGKLRGKIFVPINIDKLTVKNKAIKEYSVAKHLVGKKILKIIYIPGKLINLVTD